MSNVDWRRHPAVVVWSDDWNMNAWAPDRATYEAIRDVPLMQTPWSTGTLETVAETEALFDLVRRHGGADGLPAVFEAYYVVGNPDYDAIAAGGFRDYGDVGIDAGTSPGWERGPFLDAARRGIAEGIWRPEYHHRTHHFSAEAWLRRLRAGEPLARAMFERRMYVCEHPRDRTRENDQPGPEPYGWIRVGAERFARAFGYAPIAIRNGEQDPGPIAATGIRTEVNVRPAAGRDATGSRSVVGDLFHLGRPVDFEPFMASPDTVVGDALAGVRAQLGAGLPARLSTHRRNYASFAGDVPRNLALLDALLGALRQAVPDLVYLTSDEIRQLWQTGASIRVFGTEAVIRNWTDDRDRPLRLAAPDGCRLTGIAPLRPGSDAGDDAIGDGVVVPPGDYRATVERS